MLLLLLLLLLLDTQPLLQSLALRSLLSGPSPSPAAPRIKQVVQRTLNLADQPPIARAGQAFVREQLTMEALHCYWLGALQRYADIYYLPRTPAQEAAGGGGGGGGGGGAAVV